jgi:hemolysin activation/secretion protein
LGFKAVTPADDPPSFARWTVAVSLARETLRPRGNPLAGWALDWSLAYAHRRYGGDSLPADLEQQVLNDTRTAISLQLVRLVYSRLVMQVDGKYVGYRTSESLPPVSELYLIGGPGSLRGYRNEQFAAIHAARVTLEPRLRFDRAYLFSFYDGVYLNDHVRTTDRSIATRERYRFGYGLGLAVMEPGRRLKLSLGWNPDLRFDQPRLSVEFSADI